MPPRTPPKRFYDIWFPRPVRNITIVAPPSSDGLEDAKLTSANYAMLDRLGDRDSVYAVGKLLSRRYPNAVIHLTSSEDFGRQSLTQNFVVIGGPGAVVENDPPALPDPLVGNEACRKFMERQRSQFAYSADCERLIAGGKEFSASFDRSGYLVRDYGVFSAYPNPYLRSARIVLLHGIHTLGVLGATRLFDGELDSLPNYEIFDRAADGAAGSLLEHGFECYFPVEVMRGEVECPTLGADSLLALGTGQASAVMSRQASTAPAIQLPAELVDEILNLVKVAQQQTLDANRASLETISSRLKRWDSPSLIVLQQVLEICRRNPRIPPDSANAILRLMPP